jgi:hypothetical protein
MKHTRAAEDYANRAHKEIKAVLVNLIGRYILILSLELRKAVQ